MECINIASTEEKCRQENRKFPRFSVALPAECHDNSGQVAGQCRIVDVSEQGLGFEIESDVMLSYGQNVLLKIFLPDTPVPLSAVLKLQWINIPLEGKMIKRVGGQLLFMDVREKAQLMQYA